METENKTKLTIKEIVLYGLLAGVMVASKELLAWLPNIELVTCLIMVFTTVLGAKALYPTYVFVVIEILLYGLGLWVFVYLYIWAILVLVMLIVRKNTALTDNLIVMSVIGGIYGLAFGALSAFPTIAVSGLKAGFAYFIAGLYYDIGHCLGNVLTVALLYRPLKKLLSRLMLTGGGV